MLDTTYLLDGLNALSRAHKTNYFTDGHRGAAIIAAYYLCREVPLSDDAVDIIRSMLDTHWISSALCAPFPTEPAALPLVNRIVETLEQSMDCLRQAGHNVILTSLALKAFRELPAAVTPARIDGICRLIAAFTKSETTEIISNLDSPPDNIPFILSELLRTMTAFEGRGQGWSGHLLTYGQALIDLRESGYLATAHKGQAAFKSYIYRIRQGPLETDKPRTEHPVSHLWPHQYAYWKEHQDKPVALGHVFKYPYAFYSLINRTKDTALKAQCMQETYRIF